jgi:hypothetical protein
MPAESARTTSLNRCVKSSFSISPAKSFNCLQTLLAKMVSGVRQTPAVFNRELRVHPFERRMIYRRGFIAGIGD